MERRAESEPTMEEIVVALRETRRGADRMSPLTGGGQPRGRGLLRGSHSADLADLRDSEIERLLAENAHLNARVMFLLRIIEHEQARGAEAAVATGQTEVDTAAVSREVRAALETELGPILLVLLHLLEKFRPEPAVPDTRTAHPVRQGNPPRPATSEWLVDLMRKLDDGTGGSTDDTVARPDATPRWPKLRERMADVVNALRIEPRPVAPRRPPFPPPESPA